MNRLTVTLIFLVVVVAYATAVAQDPASTNPFEPGTTVSRVLDWYTGVYSAIIILLTYIQGVIKSPFLARVKTPIKYIVIAGAVAGLFLTLGWLNAVGIVIGFVGSALTYDMILEPMGLKTQKNH